MKRMKHIQKRLGRLSMENDHFVYILQCKDDTLYTGYAVDVEKRLKVHESGKGAKYTRGRGPFEVVYVEQCSSKSAALKREYDIKKMRREEKDMMIQQYEKGEKT